MNKAYLYPDVLPSSGVTYYFNVYEYKGVRWYGSLWLKPFMSPKKYLIYRVKVKFK